MSSRITRMLSAGIGMLAFVAVACTSDLPTAASSFPAASFALEDGGDHEEPDPRIPPVCHGYTATIWWNMPADLIPKGVIIRPTVPGDHEDHDVAGAEEHEDEAPGYVIIGTSGNDVIAGSPKRDSIYGGSGADVICADPPQHTEDPTDPGHEEGECEGGGGGGGAGQGGGGPDKVWGGNGSDRIYGGGGPDSIYAGNDADVVIGGGGPDALFGENGDDMLYGGPGPDRVFGGHGDDMLYGDVANDRLFGELGNDGLFGGIGLDVLDGGKGINFLDPGTQEDHGEEGGCGGGGGGHETDP